MALTPGTRLGPYEVIRWLAAGGMGEVYQARDARLGRDVAVKVLPAALSADPDGLRRFEQEARAAGSLDHPNILTVHDAGSHLGTVYLATELLEGETLRQRLRRGPLPLRKAAEIALQAARGLAAAHARGIVHRDLKPDNLFLTRDGRVKILDFGIAKLTQEEAVPGAAETTLAWGERARTEDGVLLGTPGYMSPEQAEGAPAEPRSDLFSFGAILYEMLTGRRAFQGASRVDTLHAIAHDEPPWLADVPPALARIVARCLEKDPESRFQSARDLAFALEALTDVSPLGSLPTPAPAGAARKRRPVLQPALAVALGLLAGVLAATLWLRRAAPSPPEIHPVTASRSDSSPAASPDGATIAFVSERDIRPRIWLRQLASGDEVALTQGPDAFPRFSPDGAAVLFSRQEAGRSSLYRVPVLGGEPRRVVDDALEGDWSPDGQRIAFVRTADGPSGRRSALGLANADGAGEREVLSLPGAILVSPRWSPDGERIALVERSASVPNRAVAIVLLRPGSGERRSLHPAVRGGVVSSLAWSGDGRELVYAVGASLTGLTPVARLIAEDVGSGATRTLLWVPYVVRGIDLLGAGKIVFDAAVEREGLREVPVPVDGGGGGGGEGRWITHGNSRDRQPVYAPGGERIVFTSTRSGSLDLWSVDTRSGAVHRLTYDAAEDWDPAFTRDGDRLLWSSSRGGHFEIWTADADGRHARQLSADGWDAENPTATPDGRWVVYSSAHPRKLGLWKIGVDGSRPAQVAGGAFDHPEISPDGRHVLYHTARGSSWVEIRVLRTADGAPVPFSIRIDEEAVPPQKLVSSHVSLGRARWMPDGRSIAFIGLDAGAGIGIFRQDFAPGGDTSATRRRLAGLLPDAVPESFGISPDGSRAVVAYLEQDSSLLLAESVPAVSARRRPGT